MPPEGAPHAMPRHWRFFLLCLSHPAYGWAKEGCAVPLATKHIRAKECQEEPVRGREVASAAECSCSE